MTQHGRMSGTLTAGGRTHDVTPDAGGACATIRGASGRSAASRPARRPPERRLGGFYWQWSPVQFDDVCLMYTCSEDGDGSRWHSAPSSVPVRRRPRARAADRRRPRPHAQAWHPPLRARLLHARPDGKPATIRWNRSPRSTCPAGATPISAAGATASTTAPLAVEGESWDLPTRRDPEARRAHADDLRLPRRRARRPRRRARRLRVPLARRLPAVRLQVLRRRRAGVVMAGLGQREGPSRDGPPLRRCDCEVNSTRCAWPVPAGHVPKSIELMTPSPFESIGLKSGESVPNREARAPRIDGVDSWIREGMWGRTDLIAKRANGTSGCPRWSGWARCRRTWWRCKVALAMRAALGGDRRMSPVQLIRQHDPIFDLT